MMHERVMRGKREENLEKEKETKKEGKIFAEFFPNLDASSITIDRNVSTFVGNIFC